MEVSSQIVPAAGGQRHRRWEILLVAMIAAWYLARLLYFALAIAPDLPPDEETHVGISELYSGAFLFIEDSPASYRHGLVTRVPYLYHLVMGKLLAANLFGLESHTFLRLWNVVLSMLTLGVAWLLARRLTDSPWVRLLFLVLATNTLMLTFLSASVSYDNLVNLVAAASLYFLIAFFQSGGPHRLLAFLLSVLLGALTKMAFLPLAAILVGLLLVERRRTLPADVRAVWAAVKARRPATLILSALVLLGVAANLELHGGNLLRYGRLEPGCAAVLGEEPCLENRIFGRNWVVNRYRKGETTFEEAVRETGRIRHPGDRDHALRLLRNEQQYKMTRPEPLNRYEYAKALWSQALKPTFFGIQAHQSMLRDPNSLLPYNLVLLAGLLLWVRTVSWRGEERWWLYLAVVALGYAAILVGWVNYHGYVVTHAPFLGVQGRYLFPVILPAYLLLARALLAPWGRRVQVAVLVVVAAIWIAGDFPYFRRHAGPSWFARPAARAEQLPVLPEATWPPRGDVELPRDLAEGAHPTVREEPSPERIGPEVLRPLAPGRDSSA